MQQEIEAPTENEVKELAKKLEIDWSQAKFGSVTPVYVEEYEITPEKFESLDISMKFGEPLPEALTLRKMVN